MRPGHTHKYIHMCEIRLEGVGGLCATPTKKEGGELV